MLKAIASCDAQYHNAGDRIGMELPFHHLIHGLELHDRIKLHMALIIR